MDAPVIDVVLELLARIKDPNRLSSYLWPKL
jgi:hypothetical protein